MFTFPFAWYFKSYYIDNLDSHIIIHLDNDYYASGAFTDFQKAFDTVNNNIPLEMIIIVSFD